MTAASDDTPDVLERLLVRAIRASDNGQLTNKVIGQVVRQIKDDLAREGVVAVKVDGLSHGDVLEYVGDVTAQLDDVAADDYEAWLPTYVLRRPCRGDAERVRARVQRPDGTTTTFEVRRERAHDETGEAVGTQ